PRRHFVDLSLRRAIRIPHVSSPHLCLPARTHPQISTLSLHDALPISTLGGVHAYVYTPKEGIAEANKARILINLHEEPGLVGFRDRKSTRLNSSHEWISYAVFCLKKKKADEEVDFGLES